MIRKLIICIAVLVGFCPMAWGTVDDVPNPKTYNADNWVSDPDHILDSETKNKINDILQQLEDSLTIEVAVVALNSKKIPPSSMMRSRPEKEKSAMVISGFVSVTIQEMTDSSPRRITSASDRPISRALSRCFGGSLSARMAINTRLSIPSTISRTISVNRPAQIEGSINNSMCDSG